MASPQSPYASLLELAHRQADAMAHGDLEGAIALLAQREVLLSSASPSCAEDLADIREVMQFDRDLATAIRRRMIDIRNEAQSLRYGQTALAGYRPLRGQHTPVWLNTLR